VQQLQGGNAVIFRLLALVAWILGLVLELAHASFGTFTALAALLLGAVLWAVSSLVPSP
jgi:hypothetical protein